MNIKDAAAKDPHAPLRADVAAFRRFNRMYTHFLGALRDRLLDTEFTFAEARVIYEVASRDTPQASEVANSLGMDAGYLSRLLGKLHQAGLLQRKIAAEDSRCADISLTKLGRAAFKKLNTRADEQACKILAAIPYPHRVNLISCMRGVEEVLSPGSQNRPVYVLRPPRAGDIGQVVSREGLVYAEEYGWDASFEALVAKIVSDFITNFDPAKECCWIAEAGGQSLGHIFLVKDPKEPLTAKLRLLFVEPGARGVGLGHILVKECLRFAQTAGYRKIVLWTQSILLAACRIYKDAGFQLVEERPHRSFGKDLVGQTWEFQIR